MTGLLPRVVVNGLGRDGCPACLTPLDDDSVCPNPDCELSPDSTEEECLDRAHWPTGAAVQPLVHHHRSGDIMPHSRFVPATRCAGCDAGLPLTRITRED